MKKFGWNLLIWFGIAAWFAWLVVPVAIAETTNNMYWYLSYFIVAPVAGAVFTSFLD